MLQDFSNSLYQGHSVEKFLQRLPLQRSGYADNEQHDAHEFMMHMIDKMFPSDSPFEGEITSILECENGHTSITKRYSVVAARTRRYSRRSYRVQHAGTCGREVRNMRVLS